MKKFILAFALAWLAGMLHAQVPNGSFENWENLMGMPIEVPSHYATSNFSVFDGAEVSVKKVPGKVGHAVSISTHLEDDGNGHMVEQPGYLNTLSSFDLLKGEFNLKFPTNGKPTKLKGYYQYDPKGGDQFSIYVLLFKNGIIIGETEWMDGQATSGFTAFTLDLDYNNNLSMPDSAVITASSSADTYTVGTTLTLDELSFEYAGQSTGAVEISPSASLAIFPNPVKNRTRIRFAGFDGNTFLLSVYDLHGREVIRKETPWNEETEIDLSDLEPGTYVVMVSDGKKRASSRIMRTH